MGDTSGKLLTNVIQRHGHGSLLHSWYAERGTSKAAQGSRLDRVQPQPWHFAGVLPQGNVAMLDSQERGSIKGNWGREPRSSQPVRTTSDCRQLVMHRRLVFLYALAVSLVLASKKRTVLVSSTPYLLFPSTLKVCPWTHCWLSRALLWRTNRYIRKKKDNRKCLQCDSLPMLLF